MTEITIPKIPEELLQLGLPEIVIIVIAIIILIWAILWFFIPFYVFGIWRRMKNIEGLIRQQIEGKPPSPQPTKRPARTLSRSEEKSGAEKEIDEETKKMLEEIGWKEKGLKEQR
jgi:hypothetical protein